MPSAHALPELLILITPKPDLNPEQLRRLGSEIDQWMEEAEYQILVGNGGLEDLRHGELPQPLALDRTRQPQRLTDDSVERLAVAGFTPADLDDLERVPWPLA